MRVVREAAGTTLCQIKARSSEKSVPMLYMSQQCWGLKRSVCASTNVCRANYNKPFAQSCPTAGLPTPLTLCWETNAPDDTKSGCRERDTVFLTLYPRRDLCTLTPMPFPLWHSSRDFTQNSHSFLSACLLACLRTSAGAVRERQPATDLRGVQQPELRVLAPGPRAGRARPGHLRHLLVPRDQQDRHLFARPKRLRMVL